MKFYPYIIAGSKGGPLAGSGVKPQNESSLNRINHMDYRCHAWRHKSTLRDRKSLFPCRRPPNQIAVPQHWWANVPPYTVARVSTGILSYLYKCRDDVARRLRSPDCFGYRRTAPIRLHSRAYFACAQYTARSALYAVSIWNGYNKYTIDLFR